MRRDVVGFEGLYAVDTDGNVWSFWFGKERILKSAKDGKGHLKVILCKDGKHKTVAVHRLVAIAFILNPENKPEINHKNGIKTDNRIENLEWVTSSENKIHAFATGLSPKGEKHGSTKHPDSVIRKVFEMESQGYSQRKIGEQVGYTQSHISGILNQKRRKQ